MTQCVSCGAELREGAKFCAKCGARQLQPNMIVQKIVQQAPMSAAPIPAQSPVIEPQEPETCPNCGKTVLLGSFTCWACNTVLREPSAQKEPVPDVLPPAIPSVDHSSSVRRSPAVVIGIIAAILIFAFSATYYFMRSGNGTSSTQTSAVMGAASGTNRQSAPRDGGVDQQAQPGTAAKREERPVLTSTRSTSDVPPPENKSTKIAAPDPSKSASSDPLTNSIRDTAASISDSAVPPPPPSQAQLLPPPDATSAAEQATATTDSETGLRNESRPVDIPRPTPLPAPPKPSVPPRYDGPTNGLLMWTGVMEKNQSIVIDGQNASIGNLRGDYFPGVAVLVEVDPHDVAIAEPPSPSNGFRRLVIRSRSTRNIVVRITWRVL